MDERARPVPDGGMDHHAGGLRDHGQVLVLEDHLERDRLGEERLRLAAGTDDLHAIARAHPAARARRRIVQPDMAAVDELLHRGTRKRPLRFREEAVQTLTRSRGRDGVNFRDRERDVPLGRGSRQGTGLRG